MIDVSVVIPTFNRRELLPRAVESVLVQKEVPFELIIVDDGSTDGTAEVIAKQFPQALCLRQENRGPAAARNRGIEAARGEWIAFLDSDDVWLEGKLAAQLAFFRPHPDLLIAQTEEIWIRNGRRVNPMKKHQKCGGNIFEKSLELCLISPSAVMIHRRLFEETGLFDESLPACEDYDLWLRITSRYPVGLIETPYVVRYGGHQDQRSRAFPAMDRFRIQSLAKMIGSGQLTAGQAAAARKVLETKTRIYVQGALKRGLQDEAALYQKFLSGTPSLPLR